MSKRTQINDTLEDGTMRSRIVSTVSRFALVCVAAATGCGGGGTEVVRVAGVRFGSVPSTVGAGEPFTITVELTRANGDVAAGATNQVTLTLLNPGGAVLNGTTTVEAVAGVATFSGLTINQAGAGRQFHASTTDFFVVSSTLAVSRGLPAQSQSSLTPAPGSIPPNSGAALTFTFKDTYGNIVSNAAVAASTSLPGSLLTPSSGTTNANGEFTTTFFSTATGSATIGAVVDGVPITGNGAYTVVDLCTNQPIALTIPSTVSGTQPCGAYIATAVAPTVYSFTSAGGGSAFTFSAAFPLRFEVTPSLEVPRVPGSATVQEYPATAEWLLPAGDYFLRASAVTGSGAFNLSAASGPGNTGAVNRFLAMPGTFAGQSLMAGDFLDEQWLVDIYYFFALSPCTITIQSSAFSKFFVVFDAVTGTGLALDQAPPGEDAVVSSENCRAAEDHPIGLYVSTVNPGETGAYTLVISAPGALRASTSVPSPSVRTAPLSALSRAAFRRAQLRTGRR